MADEKQDQKADAAQPGAAQPGDGPDEEALRKQLAVLLKKQEILTNKEARAETRYKIAQIQWQLGLMTDEQFREAEDFYESFTYEWS
jgi:hypothetical protein